MNRIPGHCPARKSSTVISEAGEGAERKLQNVGRHGYRETSAATVSSQSLVTDKHSPPESYQEVRGRQCTLSSAATHHAAAVPRTAKADSTPVLSTQQPAGMSTGARPKQRSQPEARETASQEAPALSGTGEADWVEQVTSVPELPRELFAKGYRLGDSRLLGLGTTQLVFALAKEAADGSETSGFAIKFPCAEGKVNALKGVKIQERLASLEGGDKYFVPVVEKVIENGELICHVEPAGVSADQCIHDTLSTKQKADILLHVFEAIRMMHAQNIAHLDIKPGNLIVKYPTDEMTMRFCDFEFAMELSDISAPATIESGTYRSLCSQVLKGEPYSPGMSDLWAFTLTAWMLMALDEAAVNWLSGMLYSKERQGKISSEFVKCIGFPAVIVCDDHLSGEESPSVCDQVTKITRSALLNTFRQGRAGKDGPLVLQRFFWHHFEFPADIDELLLLSADKCILKEMLSIMFASFSYSDTVEKMMSLLTAASRCGDTLEIYSENNGNNEKGLLQIIQDAGYRRDAEPVATVRPFPFGHSPDRSGREISEESVQPDKQQYR